ncbi:hypothetical protein GGR51DRAFT_69265 [Nemania sp. FL0031]|nr:hypothetical protein GGR51DRAFT_69265 [Nemania sp. FL0031]
MDMEDNNPPIQRMAGECSYYLQQCVDRFSVTNAPCLEELGLIAKKYQLHFNAWVSYLGVFANNESSLDHRLKNHLALQDTIIRLLDMLRQNLFLASKLEIPEAIALSSAKREVDEIGDHVMIDEPPSLFSAEFLGIEDSIIRLNRIGIAIRSSSRSIVTARARRFASERTDLARLNDYEEMALFAVDYLYPNTPESLRRQLANSMTDRYAKLKYKSYCMRQRGGCPEKSTFQHTEIYAQGDRKVTDDLRAPLRDGDVGNMKLDQDQNVGLLKPNSPASSIDMGQLSEGPEAAKSGIPLSNPSKSTTAQTSCLEDPLLPKFDPGEKYTNCQFCFQVIDRGHVQITDNKGMEWSYRGRCHCLDDLKPYVCLAEECSESRPTYSFSAEWSHHMVSKHSEDWIQKLHAWGSKQDDPVCPLCLFSNSYGLTLDDKDQPGDENYWDDKGSTSSSYGQRQLSPSRITGKNSDISLDQGNMRNTTTWSMASHVAGHLLFLTNISLNIMSVHGYQRQHQNYTVSSLLHSIVIHELSGLRRSTIVHIRRTIENPRTQMRKTGR